MREKKTILIVTDGTEKVKKMADDIASVLKGNSVLIKDASSFAGTDLLPAEILFFGCEKPSPPSFGYFEDLLQHINLAGRSLGIFTPGSKKAAQYLGRMVKASEAALFPEPLSSDSSKEIKKWTAMVMAGQS